MARRTEYDEHQAAGRLRVRIAAFRWARHTGLIPATDASPWQWTRATVEAVDASAVRRPPRRADRRERGGEPDRRPEADRFPFAAHPDKRADLIKA